MEFDRTEYTDRVARTTRLMREQNVDALVVTGDMTGGLNYRYYSGHSPRDYQMQIGRPHIFVLTQDGTAAVLAFSATAANAQAESWVNDVRSYGGQFTHEPLRDLFLDLGLSEARIGYEMGLSQRCTIPLQEFLNVHESLPKVEHFDASPILENVRARKSSAEVAAVRQASEINLKALEYAFARMRPGSTERTVYADVMTGLVQNGAHRPPVAQMLSTTSATFRSGLGHRGRLSGPADEPLQTGDLVFMDSGCSVLGYWCEFNRSGVIGSASAEQKELKRIVNELVQETVEETVRPGAPASNMISHLVKVYERYGVDYGQYQEILEPPYRHLVHGMGLTSSEPPFISANEELILEEGMVLSVEAKLGDPSFTYVCEEAVVVTSTGFEWLSDPDTGLYETAEGEAQ